MPILLCNCLFSPQRTNGVNDVNSLFNEVRTENITVFPIMKLNTYVKCFV